MPVAWWGFDLFVEVDGNWNFDEGFDELCPLLNYFFLDFDRHIDLNKFLGFNGHALFSEHFYLPGRFDQNFCFYFFWHFDIHFLHLKYRCLVVFWYFDDIGHLCRDSLHDFPGLGYHHRQTDNSWYFNRNSFDIVLRL